MEAKAEPPAKATSSASAPLPAEPAYVDGGADPTGGNFTLADATAGMTSRGPLFATIKTSLGDLRCKLFDDKAPITVANFVGLARGERPWKDPKTGAWVKRPAYDGTTFHRVIKGFMIQGGDPTGTGRGEPGFTFPDEMWGAKHDKPGLLCMANRGPNTNGMQFFITDAKTPHIDRSYTIFGECSPVDTVHALAAVRTGPLDKPVQPLEIRTVEITRGAAPPKPSGSTPPTGR
ncbi:Peptidyl-prolyl cis-trans isomerase [Labilithrix luteola]|uniref:Peptidyl-prolyl cis-trans isomerase n=1 Tax=Labilithrix luteola TaxID=1391654 RepID=A0A0K1PVD6_9BACT|nr:Peptidyl-prolyl cis-trans isomerase [Labilithrix luteola]